MTGSNSRGVTGEESNLRGKMTGSNLRGVTGEESNLRGKMTGSNITFLLCYFLTSYLLGYCPLNKSYHERKVAWQATYKFEETWMLPSVTQEE